MSGVQHTAQRPQEYEDELPVVLLHVHALGYGPARRVGAVQHVEALSKYVRAPLALIGCVHVDHVVPPGECVAFASWLLTGVAPLMPNAVAREHLGNGAVTFARNSIMAERSSKLGQNEESEGGC